MLISFVLLGMADVSDRRLVDITAGSGGGILVDQNFRAPHVGAEIGNVISSPTATDFARRRDKRSLVRLANTQAARSSLRWTLATRSRHTEIGELKMAVAMLRGKCRTALRDCKTRLRTRTGGSSRQTPASVPIRVGCWGAKGLGGLDGRRRFSKDRR